MISVVAFKMVPKGIELAGISVTTFGLAFGVAAVAGLNHLFHKSTNKKGEATHAHDSEQSMCSHTDHAKQLVCSPALMRSGIVLLVALSLHKLPEGIAIGAAGTHYLAFGVILAVSAMLHCLPEGMAIAAPLICGGMSKKKAVAITALGGLPTVFGGVIGMLIGGISDFALALALTIAGGTMLYVVLGEIIPQSLSLIKSRLTTYMAILGILVGLVMTFAFASPICPHDHGGCHSNHHGTHICGHPHHEDDDCHYLHCHDHDDCSHHCEDDYCDHP